MGMAPRVGPDRVCDARWIANQPAQSVFRFARRTRPSASKLRRECPLVNFTFRSDSVYYIRVSRFVNLDSGLQTRHKQAMKKLKDFISARRTEIAKALAPLVDERTKLDSKIERLRSELAEIDRAAEDVGLERTRPEAYLAAIRRHAPPLTIKQAVLAVLADHPNGLTALDILAEINRRFELGIVRTSLSPQLTRLKNDDQKIDINGSAWRLIGKQEGPTE